MKLVQSIFLATILLAAACSPQSQPIPRYDDAEGAGRVLGSLSPWKDGSPDRSHDGRSAGDPDSDRQLFGRWFMRYADHENYLQHERDYQPFNVPATVADAIAAQRKYEAEKQAKADADAAKALRQQAMETAAAEAAQRQAERQKAEADAISDADRAVQERSNAERAVADQAEEAARYAAKLEAAERSKQAYKCRMDRQQAAFAAGSADTRGANTGKAYQRAWDSFHCSDD